jgi:hypothetical protein
VSARDENNNSGRNVEKPTVKNIDWKCRYCSYTNNEEVSWAVFGIIIMMVEREHVFANIVLEAERIREETRRRGSNSCCTFVLSCTF